MSKKPGPHKPDDFDKEKLKIDKKEKKKRAPIDRHAFAASLAEDIAHQVHNYVVGKADERQFEVSGEYMPEVNRLKHGGPKTTEFLSGVAATLKERLGLTKPPRVTVGEDLMVDDYGDHKAVFVTIDDAELDKLVDDHMVKKIAGKMQEDVITQRLKLMANTHKEEHEHLVYPLGELQNNWDHSLYAKAVKSELAGRLHIHEGQVSVLFHDAVRHGKEVTEASVGVEKTVIKAAMPNITPAGL